jgi:hypothetical protein
MTSDQSRGLMRDASIGRRLQWIPTALVMALWIFFVVWILSVWLVPKFFLVDPDPEFLVLWPGLFLVLLALFTSRWATPYLFFKGKHYLARSEPAERLQDPRPPVVLLRAFQADVAGQWRQSVAPKAPPTAALHQGSTFEEDLAEVVRPIGPLVALGQPGEEFPPAGAARFHEANQTWKDRVVDLLKGARLVILMPGTSEALLWETSMAFQLVKPQQLLILRVGRNTRREYDALSRVFKEATGRELPDRLLLGVAERSGITFDEDWTPRMLRVPAPIWRSLAGIASVRARLHFGLEPVFRANGIEWHPLPVTKMGVLAWLVVAILLIIIYGPKFL